MHFLRISFEINGTKKEVYEIGFSVKDFVRVD